MKNGTRGRSGAALSGLIWGTLIGGPLLLAGYLDAPPAGHTGGFQEPTCHECHFDRPLNAQQGALELEGFPGHYRPGAPYALTVRLRHPELQTAGFQLSIRFSAPPMQGEQAGKLEALDDSVEVLVAPGGTEYAQHSKKGQAAAGEHEAVWRVQWTAPQDSGIPVILHICANASNNDDSPLGDLIYARSLTSNGQPG